MYCRLSPSQGHTILRHNRFLRKVCELTRNHDNKVYGNIYVAVMVTFPADRPFDVSLATISPFVPLFAFTIARYRPLNAFRVVEEKTVLSVGSPLSVLTILPDPDMTRAVMELLASGTTTPFSSTTLTVMKERSLPSPEIFVRSAVAFRATGDRAVTVSTVAHCEPFLYVTTQILPAAYLTSSKRILYSYRPFFLRPVGLPFTNNSASSPDVKTWTGVVCPSRPGQVQCGRTWAMGRSGRQRA